ncbi:MAG: ARMT1-like domain-containing protein [Candidatus Margulisiibacteriota bacterium]
MQALLECIPCITRQAIQILKSNVKDKKQQASVLKAVLRRLEALDIFSLTPPEATKFVHEEIKRRLGLSDLYLKEKDASNRAALRLYPRLKKLVRQSDDPLQTALRIAIAGNIIDHGALAHFCVETAIEEALIQKFAINHFPKLRGMLKKAKKILYVGDNAGEIVFDKLFIEELKKHAPAEIVFAVKSQPALNDVLIADAKFVGMNKVCRVIESGSDNAGTLLAQATPAFKREYAAADLVIAKGQGNLETLVDPKKPIFYLLMMKCPFLGERYGVGAGEIVVMVGKK